MKALAILLTSLILSAWISAIAILAIQNFSPVSLRFLGFQSIEIPVGLVLAFSLGLGILGTAIAQPLLGFSSFERDEDD
ncbi:MAG: DUF1049 domain-containing protein [Leptolyngbya sp. BL-A-14]